MNDPAQKLIDMEMKAAFLERTVEELSEVVLDQGRELERVKRRLAELEGRLASKSEGAEGAERDPLDERPPHY